MDKTEQFIRDAARMGWSRAMTRDALGMKDTTWRKIMSMDCMKDIKWPANNASVDRKASYAAQRGQCSPARMEAIRLSHIARRAKCKYYQVGSVNLIMEDHLQFWADEITVSASQIRRRLLKGMSILDALFLPALVKRSPKEGWKNARNRIQCTNHEARPADRAAQESTRAFLAARAADQAP